MTHLRTQVINWTWQQKITGWFLNDNKFSFGRKWPWCLRVLTITFMTVYWFDVITTRLSALLPVPHYNLLTVMENRYCITLCPLICFRSPAIALNDERISESSVEISLSLHSRNTHAQKNNNTQICGTLSLSLGCHTRQTHSHQTPNMPAFCHR